MSSKQLDVVIASVDRDTVLDTVSRLVEVAHDMLGAIHIVGRVQSSRPLARSTCPAILYHDCQADPFCKAKLINTGLSKATAEIVLVSDADISWNRNAITLMLARVDASRTFCHVATVNESVAAPPDRATVRYEPFLIRSGNNVELHFSLVESPGGPRPGPGLVMAKRKHWVQVGGYNEDLVGWGWEDHDLLLRARLLGYTIECVGSVIHMSHDDTLRNRFNGSLPRVTTRNRNLLLSTAMITAGAVYGSLKHNRHVNMGTAYNVLPFLPCEIAPCQ